MGEQMVSLAVSVGAGSHPGGAVVGLVRRLGEELVGVGPI